MPLKTLVMFKLKYQEKLINSLLEESRKFIKQLSVNDPDASFVPVEDSQIHREIAQNINTALDLVRKSSQDVLIRYELVTKAIKVGLWDMNVVAGDPVNPQNEFIWSDEFRKMLGFTNKEDFPNVLDSWASRLHPNDKEWVLIAFHDHMTDYSGNTPYDVEYQLQLKTGEYRWFRATGTTIRDREGVPLRVAGALFDIHSKKLEQEELQFEKKSSQDLLIRHELVTKAIEVGLWDMNVVPVDPINPNNEFIWDDKFRQMLGYKDEEDFPNILDSWASKLHPNDKEWVLKAFNDHMTDYSGNTPYDVEYQLQLKTGEYRWFRATGTTIRDKDGVPLRVAGALFDIHDKKLKEQELQFEKESSQHLLIRHELVTKAIEVGLWDMNVVPVDPINPNNEFIWDDKFRQMLGYKDEGDFPNILDSWASRLHPSDKEWVLKAFNDHMTDYSGNTPYDVEYQLQMKTGEYRWFRATGTTIRDKDGVPLRVAGALFNIHDKKLKEQELQFEKESSQHLLIRNELVTKAIQVGLWDMNVVPADPINLNNEFIWDDKLRQMLGYKNEQDFPNILDSWASRLHPGDKNWVLKAFNDHMTDYSGRTPYDVEYQLQMKTGEYRWFRATGTTIRDKDGVPLRVAGALFDIHDRKLKEQELQSEKKTSQDLLIRHELVTKAIKVGLWDMNVVPADPINLNNEFIWSDEFRNMLSFTDEEDFPNILNSWASRLHPDDWEWVLKAFNDHMTDYSGNTPYDVEYQLQMKTGEYRWFRATGTTIRDQDGVPLRVAGALFDIHDKKLQEQEHNYLLERFELINYALTEGPWDMKVNSDDPLNPQNEFWWSPQFRKLLGYYDERDFPDILSSWSERLHPEDKDRVLHAFEEHITDYTGRIPYSLDYRLRMKNGEYRWFHASGATIRNNKGVPLRVAGTIRDITNEKIEVEQSVRMQQFTQDILQKFTEAIQQVVSGLNSVACQTQQPNITQAQAAGTQEKKSAEKV